MHYEAAYSRQKDFCVCLFYGLEVSANTFESRLQTVLFKISLMAVEVVFLNTPL